MYTKHNKNDPSMIHQQKWSTPVQVNALNENA